VIVNRYKHKIIARDLSLVASRLYRMAITQTCITCRCYKLAECRELSTIWSAQREETGWVRQTVDVGRMLYLVNAVLGVYSAWCMLYSVYAKLSVCCPRCKVYWVSTFDHLTE